MPDATLLGGELGASARTNRLSPPARQWNLLHSGSGSKASVRSVHPDQARPQPSSTASSALRGERQSPASRMMPGSPQALVPEKCRRPDLPPAPVRRRRARRRCERSGCGGIERRHHGNPRVTGEAALPRPAGRALRERDCGPRRARSGRARPDDRKPHIAAGPGELLAAPRALQSEAPVRDDHAGAGLRFVEPTCHVVTTTPFDSADPTALAPVATMTASGPPSRTRVGVSVAPVSISTPARRASPARFVASRRTPHGRGGGPR